VLATRHKFKAPVRLTRRNSSRTTHSAGRSRPRRAHEFFSPPASVPRAHVVVDRRPSPRRGKPRRASMLVLRPRDDAAETKKNRSLWKCGTESRTGWTASRVTRTGGGGRTCRWGQRQRRPGMGKENEPNRTNGGRGAPPAGLTPN
jgi:hypothetical protein